MNTIFETNFTVMPTDANYMYPLIFGGAFFSQMDLCAARTVQRLLYDSENCKTAVTHRVQNLVFHKPCYVGDLVFLRGEITKLGEKSIVVKVTAEREQRVLNSLRAVSVGTSYRDHVADGEFVFISLQSDVMAGHPELLRYGRHGLTL